MLHDKATRVRAVLAALNPPGVEHHRPQLVDIDGISSGCPDTYIDIFISLLHSFWNVVGEAFVGAHRSSRSGALRDVPSGITSRPSTSVIDVILGRTRKKRNNGLAFRRIVRFNRDVLGMTKMYLLEAQFVKRNGFQERKMDLVLDMVEALKRKRNETSGDRRINEATGAQSVRIERSSPAGSPAPHEHVAPRASLPDHVTSGTCRILPVEFANGVTEVNMQAPLHVLNPLFTLDTISRTSTGPPSACGGSRPASVDLGSAAVLDIPQFRVDSEEFIMSSDDEQGNGDCPDRGIRGVLEEHDLGTDDDNGTDHATFDGLLEALWHRVASVRQLLQSH